MNVQSNLPLPVEPQAWRGNQLIYYYNHVDNGEQEKGNEGQRYCADFVIVESTDHAAIDSAIRMATEHPEKLRSIVDGTEDVWDYTNRSIRLAIPNDDMTEIIKSDPTVALKVDALKDWIVVRNRTQFIYLEEIYPEDQVLFANYIQSRP